MKKLKCSLLLICLLSACVPAFAHPPSDIKIQFDRKTKTLTAVIEHPVSNPQTHFINRIDIGLNGEELQFLPLMRQESNGGQTVTTIIEEVKPGDTLSVEAYCNLSGKLEKEIEIV